MSRASRTCSRSPSYAATCASLQAINDKIHRLAALQEKVERNSQAIARLKTIWSLVAAGIALVAAALKDWLFGQE